MFDYFDIHSHLYFPDFDSDIEEVISKMNEQNIATITVGTNLETSVKAIKLADENNNLFACIGQHPGDLNIDSVFDQKLKPLTDNKKVVAIGETGLDYFRLRAEDTSLKGIQKTIFEYHIDLALEVEKPLMLHIRSSRGTYDAYNDALEILEHHAKISGMKLRGNAHFFAGDETVLRRFLAMGFTVSFTGVITFTDDYDKFIQFAPLDMIMSETDAPFVAPVPYRGERSSPLLVPLVVKKIALIRNESFDSVKIALQNNASRHFPIPTH